MTTVPGVGSSTNTQERSAAPVKSATIDYDAFLKLLITELKTQDPTKPMDSTQFMAQLASFSNVEQGVKMNAKLDELLAASALTQAEGAIGKAVASPDGSVAGIVVSVRLTEDGPLARLHGGEELLLGPGIEIGLA